MKTMGLDLSLTSTGTSIDGITSIILTPTKGAERLFIISKKLQEVVKGNKIEAVIIEGYSFASRNSQAHSIGELGGVVRMMLWENKIPYVEVPPTSRAKFATGRGNASKHEVISAISAKTGKTFRGGGGNDECDAWVLEEMAKTKMGVSSWSWTKEQLSSLEKIDWSPILTNKGNNDI
jgi:crossover junction endodeoxyribonuclease RuvC